MAIQFAYKVLADLSKAQPEFVLLNYTTWPDAPNGGEEVRAVATITIPDVQTGGRNFGIQLFDPSLNQTIELGAYTKQAGDTTPALLAANAAAAFNLNPFGYPVASVGNVITITAKAGLGALINGAPLVTVGSSYGSGSDAMSVLDVQTTPFAGGIDAGSGSPVTDQLQYYFSLITPSAITLQDDSQVATSGLWDIYSFPVTIPQINGHMEWGSNGYKIIGYCKAPDGTTSPTITVEIPLCRPKGNGANQTDNYGAMNLDVQVKCADAQLYLQEKSDYTYVGYDGTEVSTLLRLIRPSEDPLSTPATYDRQTPFSLLAIPLFKDGEGYQLLAETVRDYELSNVLMLRLKYKFRKTFNVRCYVDLCGIIKGIDKYAQDVRCNRNGATEARLLLIHNDVSLLMMVRSQPLCGIEIQPFLNRIKKALGSYYQPCDQSGGLHPSLTPDL